MKASHMVVRGGVAAEQIEEAVKGRAAGAGDPEQGYLGSELCPLLVVVELFLEALV